MKVATAPLLIREAIIKPRVRPQTLVRLLLVSLGLYAVGTGVWFAYTIAPTHRQVQARQVAAAISAQLGVTQVPAPGGDLPSVRTGPHGPSGPQNEHVPSSRSTTSSTRGSGAGSSISSTSSSTSPSPSVTSGVEPSTTTTLSSGPSSSSPPPPSPLAGGVGDPPPCQVELEIDPLTGLCVDPGSLTGQTPPSTESPPDETPVPDSGGVEQP